jgi:hypothetical protein
MQATMNVFLEHGYSGTPNCGYSSRKPWRSMIGSLRKSGRGGRGRARKEIGNPAPEGSSPFLKRPTWGPSGAAAAFKRGVEWREPFTGTYKVGGLWWETS